MDRPNYELLRGRDLRAALDAIGDIADTGGSRASYAEAGLQVLARLVPSELTTLSRCDLKNATRVVVGLPAGLIGDDERAAFDRHFNEHPLVQYHASQRGVFAHRISDSMAQSRFVETPLYNDYYRRVHLSHVLALPLRSDAHELASFVLNRDGRDFGDRELALLDVLRRPLKRLFDRLEPDSVRAPAINEAALARRGLTTREIDVLGWVAAGKTDRDIAAQLGCSRRTVHKHLQRVYVKLGVETRTAAVMRALADA